MLPFLPLFKKLWLPVLLLGGLLVFFASGAHTAISWQGISQNYAGITGFADDHLVMAALGFALIYLLAVAFSLPIALFLSLTGGAVFGWLAVPLIVAGATLGAGIVFLAARTIFADVARARAGPFIARLESGFSANAFSYLLALRLIPMAPFWVMNIVPAYSRMSLAAFLFATFLGILPATAVFVSVGRGLDHVLATGRTPDLQVLASPAILGPLAALGLLALIPVVWRRFRGSHTGSGAGSGADSVNDSEGKG